MANPINVLCDLISSLHDEDRRITIPGFYDAVVELSEAERKALAEAPFDLEEYKRDLGIGEVLGEKGYSSEERSSIRPTLDVNGMGGYIGEGAKTVLPSKAYAKISMRLVPDRKSDAITKLFQEHFERIAPPYVKVRYAPPWRVRPRCPRIHRLPGRQQGHGGHLRQGPIPTGAVAASPSWRCSSRSWGSRPSCSGSVSIPTRSTRRTTLRVFNYMKASPPSRASIITSPP